jgi:hypothetical protein
MDVDWAGQLAEQLDWHWKAQLRPRLDGLTDDEYRWEPVAGCWNVRRREAPYVDSPMAALVLHINREVIHHGAEISLLRDLYLHRED